MSVVQIPVRVMKTLIASTPMVRTPVPADRDSLEMNSTAQVSKKLSLFSFPR